MERRVTKLGGPTVVFRTPRSVHAAVPDSISEGGGRQAEILVLVSECSPPRAYLSPLECK